MAKNNLKMELLKHLLEDPTRTVNKLAKTLSTYRKRVLQKKKELEAGHVIWGYTAVVDERKINHVLYIVQFRTQSLSKAFADRVINRLRTGSPEKNGVRVIDVFFVDGEYDCFIKFSAPDSITARNYYENLRITYKNFFRGNPSMSNVIFPLVKDGKLNPEIERLYDLIPRI